MQNDTAIDPRSNGDRLETPASAGYRAGMPWSGMIGRRLGRIYGLPHGTPREIGDMVQALSRKLYQGG